MCVWISHASSPGVVLPACGRGGRRTVLGPVTAQVEQLGESLHTTLRHFCCPHAPTRERDDTAVRVPVEPVERLGWKFRRIRRTLELKLFTRPQIVDPAKEHDAHAVRWPVRRALHSLLRRDGAVPRVDALPFRFELASKEPAVAVQAKPVDRFVLTMRVGVRLHAETPGPVPWMRCRLLRPVVEPQCAPVGEETPAPPAVALGPEGEP